MPIIRFICVNYDNTVYSKKLLESLERQQILADNLCVECVIVDNSTSEQEAAACERLSMHYSWVSYIRPPTNLGYFGGLNYGLSKADPVDAAFVVVCNNDLEFDVKFSDKLSRKRYDANTFAVCPDVTTVDGLHQNPHILRKISWWRRFQFDLYFSHYYISRLLSLVLQVVRPVKSSQPPLREGCETHMGVGACYILTSEFLKRFKKLDYPFFLYGEEAFISSQIHLAGGVLWFDPDLRVLHAESAALSKVPNRTAYEFARRGYAGYRKML